KDPRMRPSAAEVEAALAVLPCRGKERPFQPPARLSVRREPELAALDAAFTFAEAGRGSLVCVTGEPGIGKTTLVEDFLNDLVARPRACEIARGHCPERLAGPEAYSPVIDALGDLPRGPAGSAMSRLLKIIAPTWHAQASDPAAPAQSSSAEESRALSQP